MDRVEFDAKIAEGDRKVAFRVADGSRAVSWLSGLLDALARAGSEHPGATLILRPIGDAADAGTRVFAVAHGSLPQDGDFVAEGMKLVHQGRPGDGYWYATFQAARVGTVGGVVSPTVDLPSPEEIRKGAVEALEELDELRAEVARLRALTAPTAAALMEAMRDGRIRQEARMDRSGQVQIRFFDASSNDPPLEQSVPTAIPSLKAPAAPAEVKAAEVDLKKKLVEILVEEAGRASSDTLYDRLYRRIEALVAPASKNEAEARFKAEWFVGRCTRVIERRGRMAREDFVALVDDIAKTPTGITEMAKPLRPGAKPATDATLATRGRWAVAYLARMREGKPCLTRDLDIALGWLTEALDALEAR